MANGEKDGIPIRAIAIVLTVCVAAIVGIFVGISLTGEKAEKARAVFGVTLGEKGQELYQQIKSESPDKQHVDLQNETPPGSPLYNDPEAAAQAQLEAQKVAKEQTVGPDDVPDPRTLAEPNQRGCRSGPWVVNKSSRNGARPAELTAHLTVSRNVAGWGDVNAIAAWFNNPRAQASSNYIIDAEGHCRYIVNEAYKAWTQGFQNPWTISIEFIHFSTTSTTEKWTQAQLKKGALVFHDAHKRWGIPIRLVNPSGCGVPAGVTDHDRLECGNEHVDVGTQQPGAGVHQGTFPMTKFVNYIKYYGYPTCTVNNVKMRLDQRLGGERFKLNGDYSQRARKAVSKIKESAGLAANPVVSAAAGLELRLRGCDGSIK